MPLQLDFSATQSPLTPSVITLVNNSTGSDVTIVSMRVYFQNAQGQYVNNIGISESPSYENWPVGNATQSFNILTEDMALIVTVQCLNSGGAIVTQLTKVFCFAQFTKNFFYYLLQQQALSPSIVQDTSYYQNLCTYWINIIGAIQAIEIGADVSASQNCLNRATSMMNNQNYFF